ncbi:MAG: hypothetical protein KDA57_13910 [Planctomycetales bacterium]|nr:hypothetical protein [Planctomycetales bacterium]
MSRKKSKYEIPQHRLLRAAAQVYCQKTKRKSVARTDLEIWFKNADPRTRAEVITLAA